MSWITYDHLCFKYICFYVTNPVSGGKNIKWIKRQIWESCVYSKLLFFFCLVNNFWKPFVSMSCFSTLNFPTVLGNSFFFYNFIMIYIYQELVCLVYMEILNLSLLLRRPCIYHILVVSSYSFFLILTRNTFPSLLVLISVHMVLFYRYNILDKMKDRNAFIVFCFAFLNLQYYID